MKALLAYPPMSLARGWDSSLPFLENMVVLGSYLQQQGVEVIIFHRHPYSLASFAKILRGEDKPAVVCLSVDVTNFDSCYKMADLAKQISPDTLTILGGPHATVFDVKILEKCPYVDVIVRGEGELTLQEILDNLGQNPQHRSLEKVLGITYRREGKICKNPDRPVIGNLDTLPFLSYELLDIDKIEPDTWPGCYAIHIARGCSFPCHFCADRAVWNRVERRKSPAKVVEEIEYCLDHYPVKGIFFGADTFTTNKVWTLAFCELLIKKNIDIDWCCTTRVDTVDDELLRVMKKSGCRMISYGVESLSDAMLVHMKKNYTARLAVDVLTKTHALGIDTRFGLIFGFPGETEKTLKETLTNLAQLDPDIICRGAGLYQLHPGSSYYLEAKKQGWVDDDFWFKEYQAEYFFDRYYPPEFAAKIRACQEAVERRYEDKRQERNFLPRRFSFRHRV